MGPLRSPSGRGWAWPHVPCSCSLILTIKTVSPHIDRVVVAPPHPEGDRKGPIPASTLPPPLQRHGATHRYLVVFVRAGVVWSRVGTLAVALGRGWALHR